MEGERPREPFASLSLRQPLRFSHCASASLRDNNLFRPVRIATPLNLAQSREGAKGRAKRGIVFLEGRRPLRPDCVAVGHTRPAAIAPPQLPAAQRPVILQVCSDTSITHCCPLFFLPSRHRHDNLINPANLAIIFEAKNKLSGLISDIEKKGTAYLICKNGRPVAEHVAHKSKDRLKNHSQLHVNVHGQLFDDDSTGDWECLR